MSVYESGGASPEESPLVVAKRQQEEQPPTEVSLIGYLARDPATGYWRVYFTDKLESYVRVPERDIISNSAHPRDEGPLARTVVRVANAADLDQVSVLPRELQAGFLRGEFVSKLTPGMPAATPLAATAGTTIPCAILTIILVTSEPPPPPPTAAETSNASCCLCWTPEPLCPA
jgi:hypothetical protein